MNLFIHATGSEIENVKESDIQKTLDCAREYIEEEFQFHQLRYIARLLDLCNTPNLFAPIV